MNENQILSFLGNIEDIAEAYVLVREIKLYFRLGDGISPQIKVRIYKHHLYGDSPYMFETSHYLHTPLQAGPYITSDPFASTEEEALRKAIFTLGAFLKSAIDKGHEPSEEWFVPNENF